MTAPDLLAAKAALPRLGDAIHSAYWLRAHQLGSADSYAAEATDHLRTMAEAFGFRLVPIGEKQ